MQVRRRVYGPSANTSSVQYAWLRNSMYEQKEKLANYQYAVSKAYNIYKLKNNYKSMY